LKGIAHEKGSFVKVIYLRLDTSRVNVFAGKRFRMQEDLTRKKNAMILLSMLSVKL